MGSCKTFGSLAIKARELVHDKISHKSSIHEESVVYVVDVEKYIDSNYFDAFNRVVMGPRKSYVKIDDEN